MITIVTPTYNREKTLPKLYESLYNQTCYTFEWLVIDDGSNDNTESLIKKLSIPSPFKIRYIKKDNGGKHSALNLGFREALHEWIFIVDSDDWLKPNTVKFLIDESAKLDNSYNSLSTLRVYENDKVIGSKHIVSRESYIDFTKGKVTGDKAELIRKEAVKDFSFPEFKNENFMAESPLFLWLGSKGKTKFINFDGYVCKYLPDGLSDNSIINRHRCVNSTLYVYKSIYEAYPTSSINKHKAGINWWRFRLFKNLYENSFKAPIIYLPLGLLMYAKDNLIFTMNKEKLIHKLNK